MAIPFDDEAEQQNFFSDDVSSGATVEGYQNTNEIHGGPVDAWDFCFSDDTGVEIWAELASIEPVVADLPNLPRVEVEHHEWWVDYEDPLLTDFEWSGPIQPNAPPLWNDLERWDLFEGADDALLELLDSLPVADAIVAASAVESDAYPYFDEDASGVVISEGFQTDDAPPAPTEALPADAPDFTPDSEVDEFFADDFGNVDLDPPADDFAWDFDSECVADDLADLVATGQHIVALQLGTHPHEDAWDWDDRSEDYDLLSLLDDDDDQVGPDLPAPLDLVRDDAWSHQDDVEDELALIASSEPVGPDTVVLVEIDRFDPWPHDDDAGDDLQAIVDDDDDVVGPDAPLPALGFDDAWGWDDYAEDETREEECWPTSTDSPPSQFIPDALRTIFAMSAERQISVSYSCRVLN